MQLLQRYASDRQRIIIKSDGSFIRARLGDPMSHSVARAVVRGPAAG